MAASRDSSEDIPDPCLCYNRTKQLEAELSSHVARRRRTSVTSCVSVCVRCTCVRSSNLNPVIEKRHSGESCVSVSGHVTALFLSGVPLRSARFLYALASGSDSWLDKGLTGAQWTRHTRYDPVKLIHPPQWPRVARATIRPLHSLR